MPFRDELLARLPELVLGTLAGRLGGPQALGSFQQGMARRGQYEDEQARYAEAQARQADVDAQRLEQQEYERGRQADADRRAAESAQLQKLQAALGTLDRFSGSVGETATDPVAAENQVLQRSTGLETAFGLPQGQLSPFVPNMAPAVSRRKQRVAKELYEGAEKRYGAEAMATDQITLKTELFGDVKPSQLRTIFEPPAVMATGEPARPMIAMPTSTPTAQDWVIRGDQPVPIPRGTAQPGDRPYDPVAARTPALGGATADGAAPPVKLTPAQQADLADMKTLSDLGAEVLTLGTKIGWSGVGGAYRGTAADFMARNFGAGSQEEAALRATIANITATIAKLRGGTSFTANEQRLLEQYTPTIDDHPQIIQSKLKGLQGYLASKAKNLIAAAGTDPSLMVGDIERRTLPPLTKDSQVGGVYLHDGKKVKVREKTRSGFLFDEVP